ncbi:MAG: hypothetical protein GF400_07305 [Candidatus Eisenbacteria bacterium]|nr:hypothetical protein [Candidatus Eisenbacteria bacterium]
MARNILDWVMLAVCAAIIVLAFGGSVDPTRRTLMVLASLFIGVRRGIALFNRNAS